MSAYMLLCNFTDQDVRTIKEVRSAERPHKSWAKKLGVDIKAGYLAKATYDLTIHAESASGCHGQVSPVGSLQGKRADDNT